VSDPIRNVFVEWSIPYPLTISIVLTACIYLRGWFALRATRCAQFSSIRLASFIGGLAVLWLALGSPMDGFADALLSAHMVEHLLLMSAVPPLLLCGLPVVPLLRGLPRGIVRYVLSPWIRMPAMRRIVQWLTHPLVAWLMMNVTFLAWHVPSAYDFALEHENWHVFEHLCFLVASLLFWWCLIRPWPASRSQQGWGMLVFLVSADVVNTVLSAILAFCDRPVYTFYLHHPADFGLPPLQDQVLGAVIMWVLGSIVFLVPAIVITIRQLSLNRLES
jgi:cytochrome c oxidase assembly factor CtaG